MNNRTDPRLLRNRDSKPHTVTFCFRRGLRIRLAYVGDDKAAITGDPYQVSKGVVTLGSGPLDDMTKLYRETKGR